jgi:peptidoglycan/xylan/chitin deacetylase (PgdA/CDA1 family)
VTPSGGDFESAALLPFPVPRAISRNLGVFCVDTTDRVVALTYDDGPHPVHTPQVLDVLAARSATATFFVLSGQAEQYPDLVRRIVAEGHELALHGLNHRSLLDMSRLEAVSSVRAARRIVEAIAGVRIANFRPPYGRARPSQMARLRLMGLDIVMWSSDPYDYLNDDADTIAGRAESRIFPGAIVLLHDNRGDPETLGPGEVIPDYHRGRLTELILDRLEEKEYRTSTVRDMLAQYRQVRSAAREEMGY